ncbi:MAG: hypothetical protein HQ591_08385 [candidate division Zixibacteria bacterium]|nr:hypothetical protein [Candidatus Tariuqbacter arcticus]
MRQLAEKLIAMEREISSEKGPFSLFALFLREESPNRWDLVVSAPWIKVDEVSALRYMSNSLQSYLNIEDIIFISRIIFIDVNNPELDNIHKFISMEHTITEVKNCIFFGLDIRHAYIITSKRQNQKADIET